MKTRHPHGSSPLPAAAADASGKSARSTAPSNNTEESPSGFTRCATASSPPLPATSSCRSPWSSAGSTIVAPRTTSHKVTRRNGRWNNCTAPPKVLRIGWTNSLRPNPVRRKRSTPPPARSGPVASAQPAPRLSTARATRRRRTRRSRRRGHGERGRRGLRHRPIHRRDGFGKVSLVILVWSCLAKAELAEIRIYSLRTWGRSVAISYMQDLRDTARAVAADPTRARPLRGPWRMARAQSHYLVCHVVLRFGAT